MHEKILFLYSSGFFNKCSLCSTSFSQFLENGIRMTGMPAWGKTHSDEKIWAIVAFVKKLPAITAEDYSKMGSRSEDIGKKQNKTEESNHKHAEEDDGHHH